MNEALELARYVPVSFRTLPEEEYVGILWEAVESNYPEIWPLPCVYTHGASVRRLCVYPNRNRLFLFHTTSEQVA